ncbi:unnamed protein product [Schistosoma curassoni]|uniref:Uncharacterized protein n=1 Tax=Schistosoma curassoni TaxID=6186 RepID=A0A183L464_9TREM|nr:unnamed protein product [Schistosoma curassoni]
MVRKIWRTMKTIIQKIQVFINSCLYILWPDIISNNLLWERTSQIPEEEEIRKKHCQRRSGRPKNTLRREMETDMRRMNKNWLELERKLKNRVGWRVLVGSQFSIRSNRRK